MLVTGEIYHILNRGVEGRVIFRNRRDYERFLLTLLECNSADPGAKNRKRRSVETKSSAPEFREEPLAEVLCLCLMPNHFHLALKQLVDGGIAKLMQRVGNSYTKYFNIKNDRKGSLFMSRYKSVHIKTDSQIHHLVAYIHANPLDLIMPEWRAGKMVNFKKAREFLNNYTWSSYPFYARSETLGPVPRIISSETVNIFYQNKKEHFDVIKCWSSRYFEGLGDTE